MALRVIDILEAIEVEDEQKGSALAISAAVAPIIRMVRFLKSGECFLNRAAVI